jgi:hypothetical protein
VNRGANIAVVVTQSQIFKSVKPLMNLAKHLSGGAIMPETQINITERLQKIGQTAQEYKDAIVNQFKDMEVDVKDWHFSVGKAEKEYMVEVNVKLSIKPKKT